MSWLDPMFPVTCIENPHYGVDGDRRRYIVGVERSALVENKRIGGFDFCRRAITDESGVEYDPTVPKCAVCDTPTLKLRGDTSVCPACTASLDRPEPWWLRMLRWWVR